MNGLISEQNVLKVFELCGPIFWLRLSLLGIMPLMMTAGRPFEPRL